MNKDSKIFLVLISAVLITSGCVENSQSESNTSPISVNEFSITPNPAPGDQTVRVQMKLQNNGDSDVENAYARLFGPSLASSDSGTWRTSDGGSVSKEYRTMKFRDLNAGTETSPAIPSRDTVSFISPNIDEGRINTYNFISKIQYDYKTTANTEIKVMSNERYQETGESQSRLTADNSDGPIQLEVQGTTPHVFYDAGTEEEELCVTLKNQGSGTPFLTTTDVGASESDTGYDLNDNNRNKVELVVENVGNVEFDARGSDGATVVDMIDGNGYQCYDMTLTVLGTVTDLEQTTEIPIEVIYGYEEETSTTVTVEGRRTEDNADAPEEDDEDGDDDGPADDGPGPA